MYIHHNQNAERKPRLFSWSSVDGIFIHRRGLQSGGRRLCRRKRLRMCGLTSSFCSKRVIFKSLKTDEPRERERKPAATEKHIPAPPGSPGKEPAFPARCHFGPWTSSRWGFRWKAEKPTRQFVFVPTSHEPTTCVFYLIGEGLRWVVDDDGLGEIPAQDVQVFDVIPLNADAVLAEQPVPGGHREGTIRGWNVTSHPQVWCHPPDQLLSGIQDVQQLVGIDFLRCREENNLEKIQHIAANRKQTDIFLCSGTGRSRTKCLTSYFWDIRSRNSRKNGLSRT